jgi:hypothetical protein
MIPCRPSRAASRLSFRLRRVRGLGLRVQLPPSRRKVRKGPRPLISEKRARARLRANLERGGPVAFAPSIGVGSPGDLVYRVARLRELGVQPGMIAIYLRRQYGNKTPKRPHRRRD